MIKEINENEIRLQFNYEEINAIIHAIWGYKDSEYLTLSDFNCINNKVIFEICEKFIELRKNIEYIQKKIKSTADTLISEKFDGISIDREADFNIYINAPLIMTANYYNHLTYFIYKYLYGLDCEFYSERIGKVLLVIYERLRGEIADRAMFRSIANAKH